MAEVVQPLGGNTDSANGQPEVGARLRSCPAPVQLEVKPSRKAASLREVKDSVDKLEARAQEALPKADEQTSWMKQLQKDILDLVYLAWNRSHRSRVVRFLANLLQEASRLKAQGSSDFVCWQLCRLSFSLSFQDIEVYAGEATGPVVLVAGYAGSHVDDLRPVAERWATHHRASVVVLSASVEGFIDQMDVLVKHVMQLMGEGRPLILHTFSNGGLIPVKHVLSKWMLARKQGRSSTPPFEALRCAIIDSAGIDEGDRADASAPAKTYADVGWGPGGEKQSLTRLFQSLGLATLLHYGVIEKTQEELGVNFAMAVSACVESGCAKQGMQALKWIPFDNVANFWRATPMLLTASSSDQIVRWEGSMGLAEHLRSMPGRGEALTSRWPSARSDVLGEDGTGVHTLFIKEDTFVPVAHAKHFRNHPVEYWGAVDRFVGACLQDSTPEAKVA